MRFKTYIMEANNSIEDENQIEEYQTNGGGKKAFDKLTNPSEAVQLFIAKDNGYLVRYMKNPSEKVQMVAVRNDEEALQFIKNPSDKVIWAALKKNTLALLYIPKLTDEHILYALGRSLWAYTTNVNQSPSKKVQIAVAQADPALLTLTNINKLDKSILQKIGGEEGYNKLSEIRKDRVKKSGMDYIPKGQAKKFTDSYYKSL